MSAPRVVRREPCGSGADAGADGLLDPCAEVLVDVRDDKDELNVTVNDKTQTYNISDVDSPWKLAARLKEIFRFIQANMNPTSDPAQIEYAAVHGMLSTLDPHSILLDPEGAREMDMSTSGKFGGIGIIIGMRKDKKTNENRLTVMSIISLNLGILNLMPVPILDGGHILIMALEGIARRDFSIQAKEKMLLAGFVVLMMLMVTVIYNDIARLLR